MFKRTVIIILVLTVIFPAMPYRHACDVNGDSRIDLGDVIVNMHSLARSATDTRDFGKELGKALASIRSVAGLERIVSADGGQAANAGSGQVFLLPFTDVMPVMTARQATGDNPLTYQSFETPAEHGPPRCRA